MNTISPVTGKDNIVILERIDSDLIIERYYKDYNIDVKSYFEGIKKISICQCKDSLYRFYYPTILGDGPFYEKIQNISSDYYHWNWEHGKAFDIIRNNDKVLDVGCGSGFFLEGIKKKTTNVKGLEFNDLAIEKCREKGIDVIKSDIENFSKENENTFDVVCAFQVLEHISDVKSFIESCLKILKTDGKLIFGIPNNNPYLYKKDIYHTLNLPPHHIGLWDKKSLQNLPNFFKMKNIDLLTEPNFNYDYWFDIQFSNNLLIYKSKILRRTVYKILKRFNKHIAGRNLLVIYSKN